jgi:hypothetical protein
MVCYNNQTKKRIFMIKSISSVNFLYYGNKSINLLFKEEVRDSKVDGLGKQLQTSLRLFHAFDNRGMVASTLYKTALVGSLIFPLFAIFELSLLNLFRFAINNASKKQPPTYQWSLKKIGIAAGLVATLASVIIFKKFLSRKAIANTPNEESGLKKVFKIVSLIALIGLPVAALSGCGYYFLRPLLSSMKSTEESIVKPVIAINPNPDIKDVDSKTTEKPIKIEEKKPTEESIVKPVIAINPNPDIKDDPKELKKPKENEEFKSFSVTYLTKSIFKNITPKKKLEEKK